MAINGLFKVIFCIVVISWISFLTWTSSVITTDYKQELGKIESATSSSLNQPGSTFIDPKVLFKNAYFLFEKSSLTGRPKDIEKTGAAFEEALASFPESVDLYLLHAAYNLKLHRLTEAKSDLAKLTFMEDDPRVQILQADITVQEGDYKAAATRYQHIFEENKTWDNQSRLAYLQAKFGDFDEADRLYQEAEEDISAKDMRSFAWVELQRGYLSLSQGRYETAWDHYRQADQAYSGYWLTKEYMAEWLGAQRNFAAAAALYRQLSACTHRPEIYHALGDLYLFMGKPELAAPWHDKALAAYLDSARRGEVQYYHHLASLYADARLDGPQAVSWARKDVQLRQNAATRDALAWALFRDGQYLEARDEIKKALSYNWQDAHLFFHAAMIHLAAGQAEEGKRYLQKAVAVNPHYDTFHVHR